ncbi:MAG TPA: amidohydrolase family protein [Abditibacteriaceae bacterium]|nr:amidohydrolase family protein [Abditibacteriaceae bacterium]
MIIDCHNHIGIELLMYLRGEFPYGQQLINLVSEGQVLGVTRWIVFPMVTNLALNISDLRAAKISTAGALERVPYAFENRRMLQEIYELFPEEGQSIIPFAMFDPLREPAAQVAELRRLRGEYSFCGLKTQSTILQAPIKNLFGAGRVILELAAEWDLPLLIHSSVLPADIWAQASDILDIAEATPGVRFCVAHSLRFDGEQLERLAALPNAWFDCSAHRIHCQLAVANSPSVAPPERRFPSDYRQPQRVLHDLAQAYPDKLMWGSDSPYYSFIASVEGVPYSLLSTYAEEVACLQALPPELRRRVAQRNTLEFLQLKS